MKGLGRDGVGSKVRGRDCVGMKRWGRDGVGSKGRGRDEWMKIKYWVGMKDE